ncbi:MAG: sulfotransferase domain-containing protein [Saprospiraceae bacterium]|nr:sulfotransferase domain-containing protein [Saprospiraceae bacterium]
MSNKGNCINYQIGVFKQLIGIRPVGNLIPVRDDDIWLVSYPKSGNTWLRFLLGNLSSGTPVDFLSIEQKTPDIYVNSIMSFCNLPSPRIIKSHESFDPRYKKVIYIVRDPRDVVISYWKHQQKMHKIPMDYSIDLFVDEFLKGKLSAGSWKEHVGSWLGAKYREDNFILIKYEDMLKEPENVLRGIVDKLDDFPVKTDFPQAVALSSFERMKTLETSQSDEWLPTRNSDKNINFVREGRSGQWKEVLPASLSEKIWFRWENLMDELGYEL